MWPVSELPAASDGFDRPEEEDTEARGKIEKQKEEKKKKDSLVI